MTTVRSNGERELRVYVEFSLPLRRREPTLEMDRVAVVEQGEMREGEHEPPPSSSGPRNPDQLRLRDPEPQIELPEDLPLTVAQAVFVPPELAAQWREEARRKAVP